MVFPGSGFGRSIAATKPSDNVTRPTEYSARNIGRQRTKCKNRAAGCAIFFIGIFDRRGKAAWAGGNKNEGHGHGRAPVGRVYPHRHAGSTLRSSSQMIQATDCDTVPDAGGVE